MKTVLWKDPDIPILKQAKAEYAKVQPARTAKRGTSAEEAFFGYLVKVSATKDAGAAETVARVH